MYKLFKLDKITTRRRKTREETKATEDERMSAEEKMGAVERVVIERERGKKKP